MCGRTSLRIFVACFSSGVLLRIAAIAFWIGEDADFITPCPHRACGECGPASTDSTKKGRRILTSGLHRREGRRIC